MIARIKTIGLIIFVSSFILGFFWDEMRESFVLGAGMLLGLVILAACYYYESRKSRKSEKIEIIENRIFFNGKFYSMDSENNLYSSIYIENGIIADMGEDKIILKTYGAKTDNITDLKGKSVVPGFNDSHMHLYSYGKNLEILELRNAKSVEDLIESGLIYLDDRKIDEHGCLIGKGWNQEKFIDKKFPTRDDLDRISLDIPVIFTRVCGHVSCLNSKALEYFDIDENTAIEGGKIDKDKAGRITGILKENALSLIDYEKEGPCVEEIMEVIENAQKKLLEFGITSIQTDDFQNPGGAWENIIKAYVNLLKKEKLRLRITEQCLFFKIENFREFIKKGAHGIDIKDKFRIGPLKLLADGSLGARTALLEKSYSDDEGNVGISAYTEDQIDEFIDTAHKNGIPVAVHAIGDKMIDIVLDSIHKARGMNDSAYLKDGIVHCQIMNENLFNKFSDYNVGAYVQPVFTVNDWKIVESRVGDERTKYSYNWKTFVDMGLRPSFGTDAPVESPNPLENIYAAVTRKDFDGLPEEGWKPEQRLTVEEALKCYTLNSARMTGEENKKGSLEIGKFSDFSVLSEDIFEIDICSIKNVYVEMTVINGEIEYLTNNNPCKK